MARQVGALAAMLVTGLAVGGCALFGGASAGPVPTISVTGTGRPPTGSPEPSASRSPGASQAPGVATKLLAGKIVGIDPGHNGLNSTDLAFINHQIWNGREMENCNTTGTATAGGYTEALFNWNVGHYLAIDLRKLGAKIVLTRKNNDGVGPCVNTRSFILNRAHADVAISIHADGGPTWGRGFTVLEPVADGPNDKVIASSDRFGRLVHQALIVGTPFRPANYYGHDGYQPRDDLAGENLTHVPKVLIECGNMPNPADAALLTSPAVQRQIARALEAAIVRFLTGHWPHGQA